mgnify:CR=1 FL=1
MDDDRAVIDLRLADRAANRIDKKLDRRVPIGMGDAVPAVRRDHLVARPDEMLAGANFAFEYKFIDILASYTWAENRSDATPLAEILPLRVVTKLTSPKWMDMVFFVRHTWSDGQTRVDPAVSETVPPAWNRLDAGVSGEFRGIKASLEVENITNANYQSHLSYFRDPFKAGFKVYEPGLMVRLNFGYGL